MFITINHALFQERKICGERKIWSNIKKSQNIMIMIVEPQLQLYHRNEVVGTPPGLGILLLG